MSSPLARPLPGEPRYFVKRSPGGVSPAKMMSREEAAEMMMRTEFSAFSRGADADASAATPEKRPESPRATRAADTDKVAARLVAAANARAENAERRAFETEERAAARVADAEHDARQTADALGDARRVIAELEHRVVETAMRRDERETTARDRNGETADAERANAVAEANRRRLRVELELDETRAKCESAEKATTATREAARRALEAREKDARAKERELTDRIAGVETAFARERERRERAEETTRAHERRRVGAIESLLRRTARRDEPSALRAALLATETETFETDGTPTEKEPSFVRVALTSAEEELVAIEGEHARELERLRGEVVAAKAETSRAIARAEASDALLKKARGEIATARRENEHLYRVIDRGHTALGVKGTSVALRALKALDAIEARAVATYRVATRALDVARRACDAAEDVVSRDDLKPAVAEIERGVEGSWVVARDVLSEAWKAAGETRGKLERSRDETRALGLRLERAATREANARVRADVERRGRAFARLSVTDAYPKVSTSVTSDESANSMRVSAHGAFGALAGGDGLDERALRGSTRTEAGTWVHADDPGETPLRLTRRPMRVGSPGGERARSASPGAPARSAASEARGRSPVRRPAASARLRSVNTETARRASPIARRDAGPRRAIGLTSRTPSPARSSRASPSPGARRRVTFGESAASAFSPASAGAGSRPRSAPGGRGRATGGSRTASRVGAYIRGETRSVTSATEEKKALARRAAVAAAERAAALARAKASNPRSRTAPRPWHTEPRSFGSTARRRPPSARSERVSTKTRSSPSPSPSKRSGTRNVHSSPSPNPPPRDAVIASQRSPSKSPPPLGSQRHRDAIVSRTLRL